MEAAASPSASLSQLQQGGRLTGRGGHCPRGRTPSQGPQVLRNGWSVSGPEALRGQGGPVPVSYFWGLARSRCSGKMCSTHISCKQGGHEEQSGVGEMGGEAAYYHPPTADPLPEAHCWSFSCSPSPACRPGGQWLSHTASSNAIFLQGLCGGNSGAGEPLPWASQRLGIIRANLRAPWRGRSHQALPGPHLPEEGRKCLRLGTCGREVTSVSVLPFSYGRYSAFTNWLYNFLSS